MEITVEELNILLQREFERGKSSNQTITYIPNVNFDYTSSIPESCKSCPNHPSNGGSGICNCILGDTMTYAVKTDNTISVSKIDNIETITTVFDNIK